MPLISPADIEKILDANDLVDIVKEAVPNLKQKGSRFACCCPFHKETAPSFQIDQNLQLWHCFGCGEGGNVVTFVEKFYNLNFLDTIKLLAKRASIDISYVDQKYSYSKSDKQKIFDVYKLTLNFYKKELLQSRSNQAKLARDYLHSRKFGIGVAKKWNLGFAPGNNTLTRYLMDNNVGHDVLIDSKLCKKGLNGKLVDTFYNRIMFPISDSSGNVVAFGGRIIGQGEPKYINSAEHLLFSKSRVLYGLDVAKKYMASSGVAIVVEGYTDVISLNINGVKNAVATLGTALTRQHIRLLNQHAKNKIVYLFDGDEAGQRACERALQFIDQISVPERGIKNASLVALTLPNNMDPAEFMDFCLERGKDPAEELSNLIKDAKDLITFGIDRKISKFDLELPGNKALAAKEAINILAPIKGSILAVDYAKQIAQKCQLPEAEIIRELKRLKTPKSYMSINNKQDNQKNEGHDNLMFNKNLSKMYTYQADLLCLFAKYPDKLYSFINKVKDDNKINWVNEDFKRIFDFIYKQVNDNKTIKARTLIGLITNENNNWANFLTSNSKMYDFASDPKRHAEYIILSINIEDLLKNIEKLKYDKKDDVNLSNILNMQKELISLKKQREKVAQC